MDHRGEGETGRHRATKEEEATEGAANRAGALRSSSWSQGRPAEPWDPPELHSAPLRLSRTLGQLLTSFGLRGRRISRPESTLPSDPASCLPRSREPHTSLWLVLLPTVPARKPGSGRPSNVRVLGSLRPAVLVGRDTGVWRLGERCSVSFQVGLWAAS